MRTFLVLLCFCLRVYSIENIDDKLIGTASLKVNIILTNGVEFKDVYIRKKSELKPFANFPGGKSIIIQRSYGCINLPLSVIKRVSSRIGKPYFRTRNTTEIRGDFVVNQKTISISGDLDDEALTHLKELSPIIERVHLVHANFTDKSIRLFTSLRKLKELTIMRPFIDDKLIKKLKSKLKKIPVKIIK